MIRRIKFTTISREAKNAETTTRAKIIVWSVLFTLAAAMLVYVILSLKG